MIGNNPEPYYSGMSIGDSLAAHGYVVLCVDALYWGSRRSSLSQRQFSDSLGTGEWFEQIIREDKQCIDWLAHQPFVDSTRIAVAGFSFGAYRAWNIAAEEKTVTLHFLNTYNWAAPVIDTWKGQFVTVSGNKGLSKEPGFMDYNNGDFRLKDNAYIYTVIPEFEYIPFEKIGLR